MSATGLPATARTESDMSASGMCPTRLARTNDLLDDYVDRGRLPGYLLLVQRHGQEAHFAAGGYRDVERSVPMSRDTLLRIYSMTKPITSVALMTLYEQGHFQLDDPVSRYIPSWRNLRVWNGGTPQHYRTVAPARPMTIRDLFSHTSGLTYGFLNAHPVDALYRRHRVNDPGRTLAETVESLAALPLQFSPGTRWNYSVATDVLGHLVEVFSGQSLADYIRTAITEPLGMAESGFYVSKANAGRLAACYNHLATTGGYELQDDPTTSSYLRPPVFLSGGGGMVSTIDDYARFAEMLLHRGVRKEVRILGRKTAAHMTLNHLPGNVDLAAMGQPVFSETPFEGIGFGLGFSVVLNPADASVLDSPGEFAWGGAASTYFWVDPVEDLFVVFMTQLLPSSSWPVRRQLKTAVYQSIID